MAAHKVTGPKNGKRDSKECDNPAGKLRSQYTQRTTGLQKYIRHV